MQEGYHLVGLLRENITRLPLLTIYARWAPKDQAYSGDVWAPELHNLNGRWYVYLAAADPKHGNKSHRMYILEGPGADESPLVPDAWKFFGRVGGLPDDQWAIDGTVITLNGTMFFVYSGWPPGVHENESRQEIYIIQMT